MAHYIFLAIHGPILLAQQFVSILAMQSRISWSCSPFHLHVRAETTVKKGGNPFPDLSLIHTLSAPIAIEGIRGNASISCSTNEVLVFMDSEEEPDGSQILTNFYVNCQELDSNTSNSVSS